jgi:hypothetical protein
VLAAAASSLRPNTWCYSLVVVRDRCAGDPWPSRPEGWTGSLPRYDGNPVGVHQSRLATIAEVFSLLGARLAIEALRWTCSTARDKRNVHIPGLVLHSAVT